MADFLVASVTRTPTSKCALCGHTRKLTFEHLPPKSCYNSRQLQLYGWESMVNQHRRPKKYRRGMGKQALCGPCNNLAGIHYVRPYKQLVEQTLKPAFHLADNSTALCSVVVQPGAIAKQIAHMACSLSDQNTHGHDIFDRLRLIALSPRTLVRSIGLRFYIYLMNRGDVRMSGAAGVPVYDTNVMVYGELAFPPLGIVIASDDIDSIEVARRIGFCDITRFFDFHPAIIDVAHLKLKKLVPIGPAQLDYLRVTTNRSILES